MQKLKEIEFKKIVPRHVFKALMARFGVTPADAVEQTNYYFDTPDLALSRRGMAMRVREKNGSYGVTLKVGNRGFANEYVLAPLTAAAFRRLKAGGVKRPEWRSLLCKAGVDPDAVRYRRRLSTRRIVVKWEGGEICLDDNRYGRKRDYELEYEVVDARRGKRLFLKLMDDFQLEPDPHPVSKSRRALTNGGTV
jgi:uncharacterized protein YjbK